MDYEKLTHAVSEAKEVQTQEAWCCGSCPSPHSMVQGQEKTAVPANKQGEKFYPSSPFCPIQALVDEMKSTHAGEGCLLSSVS